MSVGVRSYSFQSRIWQKPCTKAKCLLRPLWQFWKKTDLIFRKRQGPGLPNKIYVKVPPEYLVQTDRNLSLIQTETYPSDGQETVSVRERKVSGSNNEKEQ